MRQGITMKGVPDLPYAAKLFIVPNSCGPGSRKKVFSLRCLCSAAKKDPIDIVQRIFPARTIFFFI